MSELLFQFDCDWTSTLTTSYILQCAIILINNPVLIISNLISFMVSKANSSSFFNTEKVTLMPTAPPSLALFPRKFSFQRLFALRLFQSFAVLWILCILSPSFLKWDCSWDHLPRLSPDAPFNPAQNGNCLLVAAHVHEETGEGRKRRKTG